MMLSPRRITPATVPDGPPILVVTVDTEEEFDWSAPFSREATGVTHMREVGALAQLCQQYGVIPCYLVDYAIVSQEEGWRPLAELVAHGLCEIGAHLHPWINPPFVEQVSNRNSYPGNLPASVERSKLVELVHMITGRFGQLPVTYRAGRYGVGPSTARTLEELGFQIDTSIVPRTSFRADEGPNFSKMDASPYHWHGGGRRLLELPLTVGWVGHLHHAGPVLQPLVNSVPGQRMKLGGMLVRTGLYERIRLSPEGATFDELVRLTKALLKRQHRVFNFSFHSPSLAAGHTPYVRDASELTRFLDTIRRYFEYFMGELNGVALTPSALRAQILSAESKP